MWIELDYYDSQGVAEGAMRSGGAGAGGRSSRRQVSWRRRPGWDVDGSHEVDEGGATASWTSRGSRTSAPRLTTGASDLPTLAAWAYRAGLSIPEVAGDDPRDTAGRVCAWAGVPDREPRIHVAHACYRHANVGPGIRRCVMRRFLSTLGRITLAVLRGFLRVLLWAVKDSRCAPCSDESYRRGTKS
jgi:hypothetical protein